MQFLLLHGKESAAQQFTVKTKKWKKDCVMYLKNCFNN